MIATGGVTKVYPKGVSSLPGARLAHVAWPALAASA
jgi:hypothetical protein